MKLGKLYGIALMIMLVGVVSCSEEESQPQIHEIVSTIATDSLTFYEVCEQLRPKIDCTLAEYDIASEKYPDSLGWRKAFITQITDGQFWKNFYIDVYYGDEQFAAFSIEKADIDSVRSIVSAGLMIRYRADLIPPLGKNDIKRICYLTDIFHPCDVIFDTT